MTTDTIANFSVTHSSGVMEHYSDEEIVKLINEQLRVSDVCVFSVPTAYFEKKMRESQAQSNFRNALKKYEKKGAKAK